MMNAFKQWWAQAPSRDQLALLIGVAFLAAYLLVMAVLKPVQTLRDKEVTKNRALTDSLENVKNLAAQVIAQQQSAEPGGRRPRSLENIVQQSVSVNGLQVTSMNASGKTGLRIRLEEAPFERVLKWLFDMEITQQFKVKDLSVVKAANPGMVTVNLRLHQE